MRCIPRVKCKENISLLRTNRVHKDALSEMTFEKTLVCVNLGRICKALIQSGIHEKLAIQSTTNKYRK